MKIASFTTHAVGLPADDGSLLMTPGQQNVRVFVTLSFRTDTGIEGIGYAGFVRAIMAKALKETIDALAGEIIGDDPLLTEALQKKLLLLGGSGSSAGLVTRAAAAIDVALWDIKGKAAGLPVWMLLGGFRDRVPAYASGYLWRDYDLKRLESTAGQLVEDGFRAMKFRCGAEPTPAREVQRMRVMRETVGPDVNVMVDINQGWDVNQAIRLGRAFEDYGLFWLEDPVQADDFGGMAKIAAALDVPVCSGEYLYGITPFRQAVEQRAIDIVMIDLLRAGGITGFMKAAHMAEVFNLPVASHLATEVLVHAMAALPNGLTTEHMPWTFPLFTSVPPVESGMLVLPQSPGLGLEFDDDALRRYAL